MIPKKVKDYFVIHEAVVLTGFSKYMLDYLARENIFAPMELTEGRRGLRRRYSYSDVVLLRALNAICTSKGKIRHLKEALIRFRDTFGALAPGQRLSRHLLVQGNELCVRTGPEAIRELRSGQLTLCLAIDLSGVTDYVAKSVKVEPSGFSLVGEAARQAEVERQRIWEPIRVRREEAKNARPVYSRAKGAAR